MESIDVAIIGGGWSGLVACKFMVANGLKTLLFESSDTIGGVWKYREDNKEIGGVMKTTHTTSSKTATEMSDYPMPKDWFPFPRHEQIYGYLQNYIDHFNIRKNIILNNKIISAVKSENFWILSDQNGKSYQSKYLIVCSGVHQFPDRFFLEDKRFSEASLKMIHSCEYKRITEEYFDKNILVYGSGETASDIATELTHAAKKVVMSVPHGQWFISRYSPVHVITNKDSSHPLYSFVMDSYSSRLRRLFDPITKPNAGQYVLETWNGKCGHGIEAWETPAPYFGQFLNKSDEVRNCVAFGTVTPKGDIKGVQGNTVSFEDGTSEEIDLIIFCCGYKTKFPFFQDEKYSVPMNDNYKFIFNNDDPTLAFIGFARPVVGSIPALAELQSIYAAKVFSGKLNLPDKECRTKTILEDKENQANAFSRTSNRIKGLVSHGLYSDQLATLAKVRPNYLKLFFKSPRKWYIAVTAPYNNCQFLIHDEQYHDQIFSTLQRHQHETKDTFSFIELLVINLFPTYFLRRKKPYRFFNIMVICFLWLIFSPVIIYRIIFHPERKYRN